jgi:hypothetical protein
MDMNLALEHFADNPIIDELVIWPPRRVRIESVRACCVMFRKPFIEVKMLDGEVFQRHFTRESFARYWAEACVILETITTIRLVSDFSFQPVSTPEKLAHEVLACREACILEVEPMFNEGLYAQFLGQFGEDCKDLPGACLQKVAQAKQQLDLTP